MFKSYLFLLYVCLLGAVNAQHQVSGYVYSRENNIQSPLVGASVYWENSTSGTVSNDDGYFLLGHNPENTVLVISYLGFKPIKLTDGFD
ncbi:MAG: TonB-dependent receptor, partial [Flavobacteriaceae bacterium]|nr:TonB-dependent receptor [Flavobacteriaceae bacterium]